MQVNAKDLREMLEYLSNFEYTVKLIPTESHLTGSVVSSSKAAYLFTQIEYTGEPFVLCIDISKKLMDALKAMGNTDIEIRKAKANYIFEGEGIKFKAPILHESVGKYSKVFDKSFEYKVKVNIPPKIWKLLVNSGGFIDFVLSDGELKIINESYEVTQETDTIPPDILTVRINSGYLSIIKNPEFEIEFQQSDYPIRVNFDKGYMVIAPVMSNEN